MDFTYEVLRDVRRMEPVHVAANMIYDRVQPIGYRELVDGTRRQIYEDARGQCVLDDDGQRVYGVCQIPEEECYLPIVVTVDQ